MNEWSALLLLGVVLEARALRRNKATLSQFTREIFHTRTSVGRLAFGAFWLWFAVHIINKKAPA